MSKTKKRFISFLLVLILFACSIPAVALDPSASEDFHVHDHDGEPCYAEHDSGDKEPPDGGRGWWCDLFGHNYKFNKSWETGNIIVKGPYPEFCFKIFTEVKQEFKCSECGKLSYETGPGTALGAQYHDFVPMGFTPMGLLRYICSYCGFNLLVQL